ncbi:MAG TPA: thioredoxin family protein [Pirellulales bacterium]|nr:thioredoxin family protein [Pirellulales bacterium]
MKTIMEQNRRAPLATAAIVILPALILLALPGVGRAGKFNRALNIGDQAPNWSGLEGIDGRRRGLADFADARLVVLVFTCNHCPVATANQGRLIALQKDFAARGVQLVALCSNPGDEDDLPAMKERAETAGFNFPYLRDADQAAAHAYGATKTPTALVLDGDRKVRYMGAIDDHWQDAAEVERDYLRDAVEALLAGQQVPIRETRPQGCEIPRAESKTSPAKR